jgi:predicted Zn-dependent protease
MFTEDASPLRHPLHRMSRLLIPLVLILGLGLLLAGCKTSAEQAEEYYQSGLEFLKQGDEERAIVQFRNVFEADGSHYGARKTLAELHARQGQTSQAYSQYLRLAEQYPDDLAVRVALARMAFDQAQGEEFARHATRAVELAPEDPDVRAIHLGQRYRAAGESGDDADRIRVAAEAQDLLKSRPDDVLLLTILLDRAGRDRDVAAMGSLIDSLLRLQPDNRQRYQQKLAYLMELGDMAALEKQLLATIEHFPEDAQVKADLIRFYLIEKQPQKAQDYLRSLADASPDDPAPRVDLIRFLQAQEGEAAARAEIESAIAAGGDPMVFRVLRAAFDFDAGKSDEAIAEMRSVIAGVAEPDARSRDAQTQLARMLLTAGDEAGARAEVQKILTQDAAHPGALLLNAAWEIEADKTDDAILALRSVIDRQPENVEALGLMAEAYRRAGEPELARDYLGQAARASQDAPPQVMRFARALAEEGRWRPAEDAILPALKRDPANVDLLGLLGQVYLSMPDEPRTRDVIRQLREIGTPVANQAAEQLELSRIGAQEGQAAALSYLEDLASGSDAGLQAKLGLIRARLAAGDIEDARRLVDELVATDPENRTLRMAAATTAAAAGDLDGGQQILRQLIDEDPDAPAPYLTLLRLLDHSGDKAAASELLSQGLAAMPDNPDLLWVRAGELEQSGDIEGAIAIYERLYAQDSNSTIVANNLASLLSTWHAHDPAKVERAAIVARRLNETTVPAFMDTYGWIQHLRGDSAAALPYLEGAAAGLPDDAMVQIHLGLVQQAVGKPEAAMAQLEKALAMLPADRKEEAIESARLQLERLRNPPVDQGQSDTTAAEGAGTTGPTVSN